MIHETDRAYIAGLFDGEGCVSYKQYQRKRKHNKKAYPTWQIRLEMSMTDESVLRWVHEVLGVGTLNKKLLMLLVGKNNGVGDAHTEKHFMFAV